jgi:predicted membrane protein
LSSPFIRIFSDAVLLAVFHKTVPEADDALSLACYSIFITVTNSREDNRVTSHLFFFLSFFSFSFSLSFFFSFLFFFFLTFYQQIEAREISAKKNERGNSEPAYLLLSVASSRFLPPRAFHTFLADRESFGSDKRKNRGQSRH